MAKQKITVHFSGSVELALDPKDYPHYFEDDEARGGLSSLARDAFYDDAVLTKAPFVTESSEFTITRLGLPDA